MDAGGGRATFGVTGIENGQAFDRPETETDRLSHKRATEVSEGHEGTEGGRVAWRIHLNRPPTNAMKPASSSSRWSSGWSRSIRTSATTGGNGIRQVERPGRSEWKA